MRVITNAVTLSTLGLVAIVGCSTAGGHLEAFGCPKLAATFFKRPLEVQVTAFAHSNLDDQYSIFICGNQFMRPPAQYLAEPFARGGTDVVPFLKDKLAQAQDDLTIRDIILVFTEMSRQKAYRVAEDGDLIRLMTEAVARMKNADWRRITDQRVEAAAKAAGNGKR